MKGKTWLIAVLACSLAIPCNECRAQDADSKPELPSAQEIIDKFISARGGEMPLSDVSTMQFTGQISAVEGSMPWTGFEFCLKGKQWRMDYFSDGLKLTIGWDDGKVWRHYEHGDPQWDESRDDLFRILSHNDPASVFRWDADEITVHEGDEVNGRPTWRLDFPDPDGHTISRFFDIESGLQVKSVYQLEDVHMITEYDDWRDVDGILFHHHESTQYVSHGLRYEVEISEMAVNEEVEDSEVAPPATLTDQ